MGIYSGFETDRPLNYLLSSGEMELPHSSASYSNQSDDLSLANDNEQSESDATDVYQTTDENSDTEGVKLLFLPILLT